MNQLASMAETQSLFRQSIEEASREGALEAGPDHLLLALALCDRPAGDVLRELGLSVDALRTVIRAQHADRLRTLGIELEAPAPRAISDETKGVEWSARVQELSDEASKRLATSRSSYPGGYPEALLRTLVTDSAGSVDEILARCDVTASDVLRAIDERNSRPAGARKRGGWSAFVPAPIDTVYAYLHDAANVPEWMLHIGAIGPSSGGHSDTWVANTSARFLRPRSARNVERVREQRVQRVLAEAPTRLVWRTGFADHPRIPAMTTVLELESTTGGTRLHVTVSWARTTGWRLIVGTALAPLRKLGAHQFAMSIGLAVSRAFRA